MPPFRSALDISERAQVAEAVNDVMHTPPEILGAPFETIRTILGAQIEETSDPMVAEALYMQGLGEMAAYFRRFQHNMAVFRRYRETQSAYELMVRVYPALVGSLGTELERLGLIWDAKGFPDVLGSMALRESIRPVL